MTLIHTQNLVFGQDGSASIPSSSGRTRAAEGASRPSGASAFSVSIPSPTERVLIGTIGRPWV
jgi:hypothetical protein